MTKLLVPGYLQDRYPPYLVWSKDLFIALPFLIALMNGWYQQIALAILVILNPRSIPFWAVPTLLSPIAQNCVPSHHYHHVSGSAFGNDKRVGADDSPCQRDHFAPLRFPERLSCCPSAQCSLFLSLCSFSVPWHVLLISHLFLCLVVYLGKTNKHLSTMCTMSTTAVTAALWVEAWTLSNFPVISLGELVGCILLDYF